MDVVALAIKAALIAYVLWRGNQDIDWQSILALVMRYG